MVFGQFPMVSGEAVDKNIWYKPKNIFNIIFRVPPENGNHLFFPGKYLLSKNILC